MHKEIILIQTNLPPAFDERKRKIKAIMKHTIMHSFESLISVCNCSNCLMDTFINYQNSCMVNSGIPYIMNGIKNIRQCNTCLRKVNQGKLIINIIIGASCPKMARIVPDLAPLSLQLSQEETALENRYPRFSKLGY